MTNQLFGLEFCAVRQDTFYLHQDCEQPNFYKKTESLFQWLVLQKMKNAACLQVTEKWNISTKSGRILV